MFSSKFLSLLLALALLLFANSYALANSVENEDGTITHHLHYKILYANVTRLNKTKQLVSVNGQFPGPNVYVRQNDRVYIKVSNHIREETSIHWHGVRQMFSVWADGPSYITQCPLLPNEHYTHNFTIAREQGTLFWHAHFAWQRATVYGAFIILPPKGKPYPFPIQPKADFPVLLGEWWSMDVVDVEKYGLADGGGYNISDALTINGQPGLLYECSQEDATIMTVKKGETYLLRVINAAVNFQMFFQIAKHKLTVVETDCSLCKPYTTDVIVLAAGQTADVLVTADQDVDGYVMASSVYSPAREDYVPFPTTMTSGLFMYEGARNKTLKELDFPSFPAANDSTYALNYVSNLRSLHTKDYPVKVPQSVDRSFLFTVGYSIVECPLGDVCHGPLGKKVGTAVNNVTFQAPSISILQAYYQRTHINGSAMLGGSLELAKSAYQEDFPSMPLLQYNYTGETPANLHAMVGTKVKVVDFNKNVQLVLQNTKNLFFESHPFHLHGYNFYVVGMGEGTYDSQKDPQNFNLEDPPAMNTVAVPAGGWVAIRFLTDNPGVWLMHCHFEMHVSWGMMMVFIVKEGDGPREKLPPPPKDYPKCASLDKSS
ncbi:hypothetical protein GOP47_0010380 [Adiantum capillus-veneris]|uniref:Laccase n=1 Tax=Adiantum capillus-veneris TaxID=13818 RepID=A0A9D4UUM8_ADICA|nr:hypothetical protein GOP47_0010380 [Adiantum capillus-veneris]